MLGWVLKVVHPPGHGASRGGNVREITERSTTPISTQAASGDGYQVSGKVICEDALSEEVIWLNKSRIEREGP